jgi:hypothetical protein
MARGARQVGAPRDHVGRAEADHLTLKVTTPSVDALEEADALALEILEALFAGGGRAKLR